MTPKEYLEQNKAGFENDVIAREKFKHIIESNGIKTIVESGTYLGSTTIWFSQWADTVYTIEANSENYNKAKANLKGYNNVIPIYGNSAEILKNQLCKIASKADTDIFFFLDAHWMAFNPLLDELKAIAKAGIKPFIAIHDFKVPGHPELGFDSYKGQDYDWNWIKSSIEAIYGVDGYEIEYNSEATGAKRGICYLYPKINE